MMLNTKSFNYERVFSPNILHYRSDFFTSDILYVFFEFEERSEKYFAAVTRVSMRRGKSSVVAW